MLHRLFQNKEDRIKRVLEELSWDVVDYFFPGRKPTIEESFNQCVVIESYSVSDEDFPAIIESPEVSVPEQRIDEPDSDLDPMVMERISMVERILNKNGITLEDIEEYLKYHIELSRLRITRRYDIILEDFGQKEVKMDPLTKTLFILYLKHPEGIRFKHLQAYRNELEGIYTSLTGRSDMEGIRKSICDLTETVTNNSANEKASKVKRAFRNLVDDRVAKFYYIDGKQGAAKSIALDRSLVIWE